MTLSDLPTYTLPAYALAAVLALIGLWASARKRADGVPSRTAITLGVGLTGAALVLGLAAIPPVSFLPYLVILTLTITGAVAVIHMASSHAIGWSSAGEIIWSAVVISWCTRRRAAVSAALLVLGALIGSSVASTGATAHGLLAGLVALAAARWHTATAARREVTRTAVEKAVSGVMTGGPWDPKIAALHGAPAHVRFDIDAAPVSMWAPLPQSHRETADVPLRQEMRARLTEWGRPWVVTVDATRRKMRASLGAPLPTLVSVPGSRTWEWIDKRKPSALGLYLGEGQDPITGESAPLWWDPDATDPHALIGGRTKRGKSVGLILLIGQAVMRGWDVIIIDPKGVDFVWAGRLPGVRLFPGADALQGLAEADGEMRARQEWLHKSLWSGAPGADSQGDLLKVTGQPYRPCLVVMDEAAEVAALGDKDDRLRSAEIMSSLARLSRFAGMVCAYATQRPDASFIPGDAKANLGTRVLYGRGDSLLTPMVLGMKDGDVPPLTDTVARGRGMAVIAGDVIEFQGAYISPETVRESVGGWCAPDALAKIKYASEPSWREQVRTQGAVSVPPHPDFARARAEVDARAETETEEDVLATWGEETPVDPLELFYAEE